MLGLHGSLLFWAAVAPTTVPSPQQLLLGTRLFGDGQDLMARIDAGIHATVQRPTKMSVQAPLIAPDYEWEGSMHMYGSVVAVGPSDHRIYYACDAIGSHSEESQDDRAKDGNADGPSSWCVATSSDGGITFTKPMLPYFSYHNYSRTNIVFRTESGWVDSVLTLPPGGPAPVGTPSGTRHIMVFDDGTTDPRLRAMQLAISADGFNFTRFSAPSRLPESFADTSVSLSLDPSTLEFVAFGRNDGTPDQHPGQKCGNMTPSYNMQSVRAVKRGVSPPSNARPSLLNFSATKDLPLAFDRLDPQCLDIYNTAAVVVSSSLRGSAACIPARTGQWERAYLAFPSVFQHYGQVCGCSVARSTGHAFPHCQPTHGVFQPIQSSPLIINP